MEAKKRKLQKKRIEVSQNHGEFEISILFL